MEKQTEIPCQACGLPTKMLATKLCDNCWEINCRAQVIGPLTFNGIHEARDWATMNMRENGFPGWVIVPVGHRYGIRVREGFGPLVEIMVRKSYA